MPQFKDVRGLAWTVGSEALADELFLIFDRFLTYRADTMDRLDAVLSRDPACPSALILKGFLNLFARSLSLVPEALRLRDQVAANRRACNPRELQYLAALKHWAAGDLRGAQLVLDSIVTEYPRDVLALRIQHVNAIFFGHPGILRTTITRALGDWDELVPGAGFVFGMACMGLEEVGEYQRAEELGRLGAELEPDDLWSVHSVAHVMEAQGRLDDGVNWMQRPEGYWDGRGPMRHHLWWHEALFLFEAAEYERLFAYYDKRLSPGRAPGYLEMANCASLLFRLEAVGVATGDRWEDLVDACAHLAVDRALTFSDVHLIIALTMAGRGTALARLAGDLVNYADPLGSFDQEASARISVPLSKAMKARIAGDLGTATDILLDARFDFSFMGGSIAQRDMLDIMLFDCAHLSGRKRLAGRLLNEYRDRHPNSVPMSNISENLTAAHAP